MARPHLVTSTASDPEALIDVLSSRGGHEQLSGRTYSQHRRGESRAKGERSVEEIELVRVRQVSIVTVTPFRYGEAGSTRGDKNDVAVVAGGELV